MKKFVYNLMFIAVAVLSVVSFASCNAEDDGYDYTNNSNNSPTVKTVSVYSAMVSEDCMNLYDVTVTLHSGDKSKTVSLTESNGEKHPIGSAQAYFFAFDNVDGKFGVDKVEATVTPKANIEQMIQNMDPNKDLYVVAAKAFVEVEFKANGKYDVSNKFGSLNISTVKAGNMTKILDNGKISYNFIGETNAKRLSK